MSSIIEGFPANSIKLYKGKLLLYCYLITNDSQPVFQSYYFFYLR